MQQYQNQCSHCSSTNIVKNGRTNYGKQNQKCKGCKRQFVVPKVEKKVELKETVKKLLLERISLRGICRVVGKSLGWLMYFLQKVFEELPRQLPIELPAEAEVDLLHLEADEMWSFVGDKSNKEWIGLAMEQKTR